MGDLFIAQETLVNHLHREGGLMPGPVPGVGQPLVGAFQMAFEAVPAAISPEHRHTLQLVFNSLGLNMLVVVL